MDRSVYLQALKATQSQAKARLLDYETRMFALIEARDAQWHDAAAEVIAGRREVAMLDQVIASEEQTSPLWAACPIHAGAAAATLGRRDAAGAATGG